MKILQHVNESENIYINHRTVICNVYHNIFVKKYVVSALCINKHIRDKILTLVNVTAYRTSWMNDIVVNNSGMNVHCQT